MKNSLQINQFTDYRTFLYAHVQDMKKRKTNWSYGVWAKNLGLQATSSITKIINGERDPGPKVTERLIKYFSESQR